jgi:DNA-binding PadR family transcriptional regulator
VGVERRPPSYFALAAPIDGPLHGYAIARRARELSGGRVRISTATLYALLECALRSELEGAEVLGFDRYLHPSAA